MNRVEGFSSTASLLKTQIRPRLRSKVVTQFNFWLISEKVTRLLAVGFEPMPSIEREQKLHTTQQVNYPRAHVNHPT